MSATAQDELSTLQENLTCQGSEATTSIFSHVVSFYPSRTPDSGRHARL